MTNFVLLSTQRSGTTWLIDALNNVPGITAHGELLLERPRPWDAGSRDYPGFIETDYRLPASIAVWRYLDGLYRRPGCVGFKLMYSQLRLHASVLPYLWSRRIQVVHLIRDNYLDMVVSLKLMRTYGRAHATKDGERLQNPHIYLEPQAVVDDLERLDRKINAMRRLLRVLRMSHIEIHYETLVSRPTQFEQILRFLGASNEGVELRSRLVKMRQKSHANTVTNYAEVKAALLDSRFAYLISEAEGLADTAA